MFGHRSPEKYDMTPIPHRTKSEMDIAEIALDGLLTRANVHPMFSPSRAETPLGGRMATHVDGT
jgi:hypothetical protein